VTPPVPLAVEDPNGGDRSRSVRHRSTLFSASPPALPDAVVDDDVDVVPGAGVDLRARRLAPVERLVPVRSRQIAGGLHEADLERARRDLFAERQVGGGLTNSTEIGTRVRCVAPADQAGVGVAPRGSSDRLDVRIGGGARERGTQAFASATNLI
jgi:hypothetical protein